MASDERTLEQVRAELERTRERVAASALVLREKAAKLARARQWFRSAPIVLVLGAVVGAAALGYVLSARPPREPTKKRGPGALGRLVRALLE
jgi:hypothetical protein